MDKILRNGSAHQILKARGFSEKKTPDFFRVFFILFQCPNVSAACAAREFLLQFSHSVQTKKSSKAATSSRAIRPCPQGRRILCAASGCLRRRGASFVKQNFCRFVVDKRLLLTVCSFCFWGSGRTPCCSRDALSAALFPYRGIRRRQACRQRSKTPYCFLRKVCPPDI